MFSLSNSSLETLRPSMSHAAAGGYVTFEGWVRDHNEGKTVRTLEYEAFAPLACKEGERILQEARERFEILDAQCVHRTGLLEIGEMAIWIGVTAPHRGAAFEACEYIINQVKHRVPIWKKETYTDGDSGWVNCQHCHAAAEPGLSEAAFYERQMILPEIGPTGQQRLKETRVLVVGAGGLGSAALQSLAAAGVGTLGICEPDRVEVSNLHRQLLYRPEDVSMLKTEAAARHLRALNPFVKVLTHPVRLDADNAECLVADYDWVLDCTDNFEAAYALNDAAVRLGKPLIQTSIHQYEGQMSVYRPEQGSPCLRCLWPQAPAAGDIDACSVTGVLGATASLFGTLQALELLKQVLALPGRLLPTEWLTLDLLGQTTHRFKRRFDPACPSGHGEDGNTIERDALSREEAAWLLSPPALVAAGLSAYEWVDIGEQPDPSLLGLGQALHHWPAPLLESGDLLQPEKNYLLLCPHGGRSLYLAKALYRRGFTNVAALAGGNAALQRLLSQTEGCCAHGRA